MSRTQKHSDFRQARKPLDFVTMLTVVSAIMLFGSWLAQNYFESDFRLERERLNQYALLYGSEASESAQYLIAYHQEKSKANPDIEIEYNTLTNFLIKTYSSFQIAANALRGHNTSLTEEEKQLIKQQKDATDYLNSQNFSMLEIMYSDLMSNYYQRQEDKRSKLTDKYNLILQKEQSYNNIFLVLYCIGAGCGGIAFFLERKRKS